MRSPSGTRSQLVMRSLPLGVVGRRMDGTISTNPPSIQCATGSSISMRSTAGEREQPGVVQTAIAHAASTDGARAKVAIVDAVAAEATRARGVTVAACAAESLDG